MSQTLQFTPSLAVGFGLGLLNWILWSWWGKKLTHKEPKRLGFLVAASLMKLGIFAGILWLMISKKYVAPEGFLAGFSLVVVGMILKGFAWK